MIVGYSAAQIRAAEEPLLAAGVPLMQRAAHGLALEIEAVLASAARTAAAPEHDTADPSQRHGPPHRVLLLVGSGNNGGDALFAGAELAERGVQVRILSVGSRMHDAGLQAALAAGAQLDPTRPDDADGLATLATSCDAVVDAILGTGTGPDPALRGPARTVVAAIKPICERPGGPAVIAVDIPSGIDPTTGAVTDPLVLSATVTVTFGGIKSGLLQPPGARFAGRVVLVDIGLAPALAAVDPTVRLGE
jgi:NAD(P)H-hydrate epimerase